MTYEQVEVAIGDKKLIIQSGHIAKQASGAALVRLGDTVVLATACVGNPPRDGGDFFPLTVDYREKAYAAGKIPGGYFKREGRPAEREILSSRLIDRPIRPLFPEGYINEVQILVQVLSSDQENDSDVLGIIAASAALTVSEIPFYSPLGAARVAHLGDKFVAFPVFSELEGNDLNIVVAGTKNSINMVEGGAREIGEDTMIEALIFAQDWVAKVVAAIEELKAKCGKAKPEVPPPTKDPELLAALTEMALPVIKIANHTTDKLKRQEMIKKMVEEVKAALAEKFPDKEKVILSIIAEFEREDMREMILSEGRRIDGRACDEIRPIEIQIGVLPRTHGSAIFQRGQTQALVVATLGTKMDEQKIDDLLGESFKSYMLHYNFPPSATGEVKPMRGTGRREIGHGALAERAIEPVIPIETAFPYTIRIVSDILESNGSSSMATVCGGSLSLMDAGVPIKSPVAGIAMGLITEGSRFAVLTDILGAEDHLGDMDFKVCGTSTGITAFQMDVKVSGISIEIMRKALEQARLARLFVLGKMNEAISTPRADLSPFAPRIIFMKIKIDKIGEVIGPGGKNIRAIIEKTGVKIDIEDDGTVLIASVDQKAGEMARSIIEGMTEEAQIGKVYTGTVRRTTNFGAFIEIIPGTDGMVHISELENHRVNRVEDVIQVGDTVKVKVIDIDPEGKIRLSRRAVLNDEEKGGN
jgi:polyribonucleotide nucleotidyltransferase